MRIRNAYLSNPPTACGSHDYGETEDYMITVIALSPCTTPTAQPTTLVLTQPSNGTISGSFTAASPAPTNYLVVYNTTGTAPSPSNTTTYTVGGTIGAGNIVADIDTNTTFSVTGLNALTQYYFFVFSYNTNCSGGPLYLTTSPLTANATTPFFYCTANNPTNTTYYISGVTTTGGVTNFANTGTTFSTGGYFNYSGTYSVSQYQGSGFSITATHPSSTYGYSVWVDWNNDGDFVDTGENVLSTGYLSSPASVGTVTIPVATPAGSYRMRIRNAYLSNPPTACGSHDYGETEDYIITCLGPLPCAGYATNIYANATTSTTATISWTAASPVPANGYQYYYSTSNVAPTVSTIPSGSIAAGILTANLTGLSPSTTYYVWVRSNCGGGLGQGAWNGPVSFYLPICTLGNGTGISPLGCPNVVSGGIGLSGADPASMNCTSIGCVDLEATYLQLGQTTSYTVQSIAYAPPYQFGCLDNPVSVNADDVWSPVVNLPFNFCFYGTSYNSCLIGSNGILSFNTTNASGPTGYSFSNNLPSTTGALFANTIYGVYHDIDPSIGGEVGWELITLNSGCRALIASWSNVPMFSDNTILYTGMMVLYENTNIIEVYIKEKNIDNNNISPWNGGNAIVGLQNATGTSAVVAPGRNGLDTNWTVTNEAWRFVPSGTSITSLKWYQGSGTTGTVLGTTDTINVCPTSTTTYTAEVTYTLCNGTTLKETDETTVTINGSKVWDGSTDTDWNKDDNWTPVGIPNSSDCVIIPVTANNPIISATSVGGGLAGTLSVYNNATLTINSNNSLTVTDWVNVQTNGTFLINNSSSLVQINNVSNTGNIVYKRDASIRRLDYVYWSSPVANFNVNNIASPLTSGGIYKWNTTVANTNGGQGNWQSAAGNTMIAAKGYIARGPSSFSSTINSTLNGSFTGIPNNGTITFPIERGTDINTAYHVGINGTEITNFSDNWNLTGNPYPSAIRGSQFLFDNRTKIEGNIKLWTHGTLPDNISSPFYGTFIYNYSPGDYLTYNFTGTSCCPAANADLFIGAGQGFFVQMVDGAQSIGVENITFNNNLRSATYSNSTFYKLTNSTTSSTSTIDINNIERNRIWLDIINSNNQSDRTLFGYIENATMGRDSFYDCLAQNTGGTLIYSLIDDTKFTIQGRALPFDVNDEVPIGINIPTQGNYTIAIAGIDGLFNNQNIYLKDNLLNITYDIKVNPYQFTSPAGEINDRFKIIYIDNALGNPGHSFENNIKVIVNNEVTVNSSNLQMESIVVYNVLGQKLGTYSNIYSNQFMLSNLNKNNTTLLLKIKLQTGEIVIKKIIY